MMNEILRGLDLVCRMLLVSVVVSIVVGGIMYSIKVIVDNIRK